MLNVDEAIAVIFAASEIEKMREVLERGEGVPTEALVELEKRVNEIGGLDIFKHYRQEEAYRWFLDVTRKVHVQLAFEAYKKATEDLYEPSPVLEGDDPFNSKDDLKFDKGFGADNLDDFWEDRDREEAEHDANNYLIEYRNGDVRCSCGCDRV